MKVNPKMTFAVVNFVLIFTCNCFYAQNDTRHFKTEIDFGNGIVISTFLDVSLSGNQFEITSPKNADTRIMGGKAKLGRLMGKSPKKGIIVTIRGSVQTDSLFGNTKIPMFGKLKFKGLVNNQKLSGTFQNDAGTTVGSLNGVKSAEEKIVYDGLYSKMMTIIQDNIYSKEVLNTAAWAKFNKKIEKLCDEAHDDIELFLGFNILAQKLPFSHLTLAIAQSVVEEEEEAPSATKSVVFEQKNTSTAYLQIKNFSNSSTELAEILPQIVNNTAYKNLIIDLRNNGGGGINAAFELAKYITAEDLEVGYFPTNKLVYSGYQPELFETLQELQPKSTEEFGNELKKSSGVKLIFKKPINPVFSGNIYVLTNNRTASTCEPIVYALKARKKAVIIGEKTAGAMLSASPFVASGKFMLMIPIADFYTNDGVRLDKTGVTPDVLVKSDDAVNKALEIINTDSNIK